MGKNKKRNKSKSNAKAPKQAAKKTEEPKVEGEAPPPAPVVAEPEKVEAPAAPEKKEEPKPEPVAEPAAAEPVASEPFAEPAAEKEAEAEPAAEPAAAPAAEPAATPAAAPAPGPTLTPAPTVQPFTHAKSVLSSAAFDLCEKLAADGQDHLFAHWVEGADDNKKVSQMGQLLKLHESYPLKNGLLSYTENARKLLAISKEGKNPLAGWVPSVPQGETLTIGTPEYDKMEAAGIPLLNSTAFVLVAGGLGERLGYNGIKVELPTETSTGTCYLQYYIETILALQSRYAKGKKDLELAIMVSDDTHEKTLALLEVNNYFGMKKENLTLMKQEKVAAIKNNDGAIAQVENDPWKIESKPHGHGDVHSLMHSSGTAAKWTKAGFNYVVFFQDTNGLGFHTLAASLGVSKSLDLVMNSLAIPRKAKQAVGAVCKLTNDATKEVRTINVEYNQLDPLLRDTINKDGDVNDEKTGFSPFPGNINQLIFSLKEYNTNLKLTSGVMAEFVNPKYADAEKTVFKKPTRLECMMQDYPMVLKKKDSTKVGFTSVAADMCFSPVKNATTDGVAKQESGTHPAVAFSGESDQYNAVAKIMRSIGCKLDDGEVKEFEGIKMPAGPKVVVSPFQCNQPCDYKKLFPTPEGVKISGRSTLIIQGRGNITIRNLDLDGALVINADKDKFDFCVDGLVVKNKGWVEVKCKKDAEEWVKMRGYTMEKLETCEYDAGGAKGDVDSTVAKGKSGIEIGDGEATDCGCNIM